MAINTLPTGDAGQEQNPTQLKLWGDYQRAVAEGRERQFLKQHPTFKKRSGASMPAASGVNKLNDDSSVGQVLNAAEGYAQDTAQAATQAQNVQQVTTDTGTAGGYIDPATGRYVMTSEGTQNQKDILAGGEQLSIGGQKAAQENLNNYKQFQSDAPEIGQFGGGQGAADKSNELIGGYKKFDWQGSPEERQRIEESVYNRLTANVDRDFKQEKADMEQEMYNRGIPLDPTDPNYKKRMDSLNEKYQNIKSDARGQAVEMGGSELQRSYSQGLGAHQQGVSDIGSLYGVGESAYKTGLGAQGQEFNQDLATQQQGLAETQALSQLGTGYQGAPQLDFNAPDYNQVNAGELWLGNKAQNINKYGIDEATKRTQMQIGAMNSGEEEEDDSSGL